MLQWKTILKPLIKGKVNALLQVATEMLLSLVLLIEMIWKPGLAIALQNVVGYLVLLTSLNALGYLLLLLDCSLLHLFISSLP
jgi:hypothetical protein